MDAGEFNAGGKPCYGLPFYPGGVEIFLVALYCKNNRQAPA